MTWVYFLKAKIEIISFDSLALSEPLIEISNITVMIMHHPVANLIQQRVLANSTFFYVWWMYKMCTFSIWAIS